MRAGQLALSAGSPVHSLRPQLPCPPALTTCWGGPDFKAVVLRVDNLEKRFDFLRTVDGRTGGGGQGRSRSLLRARQRAGPNLCPAGGRLLVSPGLTGRPRVGRHREGATFWPKSSLSFLQTPSSALGLVLKAQQEGMPCSGVQPGPPPPAAPCVRVWSVCVRWVQAAPARVQQSAGPLSALQGWEQLDGAAPLRVSGAGVGGFGWGLGL